MRPASKKSKRLKVESRISSEEEQELGSESDGEKRLVSDQSQSDDSMNDDDEGNSDEEEIEMVILSS